MQTDNSSGLLDSRQPSSTRCPMRRTGPPTLLGVSIRAMPLRPWWWTRRRAYLPESSSHEAMLSAWRRAKLYRRALLSPAPISAMNALRHVAGRFRPVAKLSRCHHRRDVGGDAIRQSVPQ